VFIKNYEKSVKNTNIEVVGQPQLSSSLLNGGGREQFPLF